MNRVKLRSIVLLIAALFFFTLPVEADSFKKSTDTGCFKKARKFPQGTCANGSGGGGGALTNTTSTDFNDSSFNGRIEGPTDTAIHTAAPIGDFSGCLWYEVDTAIATFQGPVGSASSFSYNNGYGIYRGASDSIVSFYVGVFTSDFDADFSPATPWAAAGGWHQLCYSFDAANRQYTVWFDADQRQSGINIAPVSRPLGNTQHYGATGSSGTSGTHFEGKVDEGVFWLSQLTQADVTSLYNSGTPIDPTTVKAGPEWWLRMGDDASDDETVITGQVTDQTANANDFTPQGSDAQVNFVSDVP